MRSLTLLLLLGCETDKHKIGEVYCYSYASNVCALIQYACIDEMSEAWTPEDTSEPREYNGAEWLTECIAIVIDDCADCYAAASTDDEENVQYVIQATCSSGYSPEYSERATKFECDEVAGEAPEFKPDWPYLDVCPCLETGDYQQSPFGTECAS